MSGRRGLTRKQETPQEVAGLEMRGVVGYPIATPATFASKTVELTAADITVVQLNATDVMMYFTKDWSFNNTTNHFSGVPITHFHDHSLRCKYLGDNLFKTHPTLVSLIANGATSVYRSLLQQQTLCTHVELNSLETMSTYSFYGCKVPSFNFPSAINFSNISYGFTYSTEITEILMPVLQTIGGATVFQGCNKLTSIYMPSLQSFASNPFINMRTGALLSITVPVYFQTSNGGAEDANIAYCRNRGNTIIYV